MTIAACKPWPATSPTTTQTSPLSSSNTSYQSPPTPPRSVGTYRAANSSGPIRCARARNEAPLQHLGSHLVPLEQPDVHGVGKPIGHDPQQLDVVVVEPMRAQGTDVEHTHDGAAADQRHADHRADALLPQDGVRDRRLVDPVEHDRPSLGGDAPGEPGADRDADALPDLLLDASRRERRAPRPTRRRAARRRCPLPAARVRGRAARSASRRRRAAPAPYR